MDEIFNLFGQLQYWLIVSFKWGSSIQSPHSNSLVYTKIIKFSRMSSKVFMIFSCK